MLLLSLVFLWQRQWLQLLLLQLLRLLCCELSGRSDGTTILFSICMLQGAPNKVVFAARVVRTAAATSGGRRHAERTATIAASTAAAAAPSPKKPHRRCV